MLSTIIGSIKKPMPYKTHTLMLAYSHHNPTMLIYIIEGVIGWIIQLLLHGSVTYYIVISLYFIEGEGLRLS